jgi:hypothetical protein
LLKPRILQPVRWTWRQRAYQGDSVLDHWVTTAEWWRQEEATGAEGGIEHWLIEASSTRGAGQVELAFDEASKVWAARLRHQLRSLAARAADNPDRNALPSPRAAGEAAQDQVNHGRRS